MSLTLPSNVEINKTGELTPEQEVFFQARARFTKMFTPPLVLVCGLLVIPCFVVPASLLPIAILIWLIVVGLVAFYLKTIQLSSQHLQMDLQKGQLSNVGGEVDDKGGIWVASPNKLRFRFLYDGQEFGPGLYRFYYLPRSRWVISVECLSPAGNTQNRDRRELARLGIDDPNSLADNRLGRLSPSQAKSVLRKLILVVLRIIGAIFIWGTMIYLIRPKAAISGMLILLLAFSLREWLKRLWFLFTDLKSKTVMWVQGRPSKVFTGATMHDCIYTIDHLQFKLDNIRFDVLDEETTYRVFYTPLSRQVVGVEIFTSAG